MHEDQQELQIELGAQSGAQSVIGTALLFINELLVNLAINI
jgi:hypothetical protein